MNPRVILIQPALGGRCCWTDFVIFWSGGICTAEPHVQGHRQTVSLAERANHKPPEHDAQETRLPQTRTETRTLIWDPFWCFLLWRERLRWAFRPFVGLRVCWYLNERNRNAFLYRSLTEERTEKWSDNLTDEQDRKLWNLSQFRLFMAGSWWVCLCVEGSSGRLILHTDSTNSWHCS